MRNAIQAPAAPSLPQLLDAVRAVQHGDASAIDLDLRAPVAGSTPAPGALSWEDVSTLLLLLHRAGVPLVDRALPVVTPQARRRSA